MPGRSGCVLPSLRAHSRFGENLCCDCRCTVLIGLNTFRLIYTWPWSRIVCLSNSSEKIWNFVLVSLTRCARRSGCSIYLFLLCQTQHFWNDLPHFPRIKFHFDYLAYHQAGCLCCRHLHCGMALLEFFLFCEVVLLNTCPTTFLFFCFRPFCCSHLYDQLDILANVSWSLTHGI